jgi:hypothetical protein
LNIFFGSFNYPSRIYCLINCKERAVTGQEIENQINLFLQNVAMPEEFFEIIYQWIQDDFPETLDNDITVKAELENNLNKLESQTKRLLKLRVDNEITADEYAFLKENIVQRKSKLKREIILFYENSKIDKEELADYTQFLISLKKRLAKMSLVEKKETLLKLCSNLVLRGKSLYFPTVSAVFNLQEAFVVYSAYFGALEPKNRHIEYSDFRNLSELKSNLLGSLRVSRTLDCKK